MLQLFLVAIRPEKSSPSSRALKAAITPALLKKLEELKVHRTETYRYARGEVTPSAERAATIEQATTDPETGWSAVPANGWSPDAACEQPKTGTEH